MSSHKSENEAKKPLRSVILEKQWQLLKEWRVGNQVLLFVK
jgi:hypothetical protein